MHNMNSNMNKKAMLNSYPETIHRPDESVALETNKSQNVTVINVEFEQYFLHQELQKQQGIRFSYLRQ
jgi:hypothetical protein